MTLEANSLRNLVDHIVEIDSFKSKMGSDDSIVTLAFKVKTEESAKDLAGFIERGYSFVLDADKTAGEQADGMYRVFVEIERNRNASEQIMEILDGIGKLAEIDNMKYRYYKNFRSVPATQDSLEETLPKSSDEYNGKVTETRLENYKNFFSNGFVEDVDMTGDTLIIRKKYSEPVHFNFVDIGDINNIYETVEGKFDLMESYPEILFLTKYFGDYNISKYGDNFVFENQGKGLVLKRI